MGHQARHVNHIGFHETEDHLIFKLAAENEEVIITHDNDFSTLLAFSGAERPSVILFRLQKVNTEILASILRSELPKLMHDIENGAMFSIDEYAVRIRKLPILRAH